MRQLRLVSTLRAHEGTVWSVAWSSRELLASCGADRSVRVWHCTKHGWALVTHLTDATFLRAVRDVTWSADGRSIAAASFDGTATVLELLVADSPKLDPVVCLEGHDSEVKSVAYSSSGGLLATCSRDRSVWVWEVGLDFEYDCIAVLNGHSGDVKSIAWHSQLEMLVSCSYDDTVKVWVEDADDWFCCETLAAHAGTVWSAAFEKAGNGLATVSSDGVLVVWRRENPPPNIAGGVPRFKVTARVDAVHSGEQVLSVDWGKDGLIATGGADDSICILEKTAAVEHESHVNSSEDGAADEKSPIVTKLSERWQVIAKETRAHCGDVNRVAWNPVQTNMLASCGDDGLVRIWQVHESDEKDSNMTS